MAGTLRTGRGVGVVIATGVLLAGLVPPARAGDGAELYQKRCRSCHGDHGKGDGPVAGKLKTPPADLAVALAGKDDAYVAKVIREGGAAVGKSVQMPAAKNLTDAEIGEIVTYVKGLIAR